MASNNSPKPALATKSGVKEALEAALRVENSTLTLNGNFVENAVAIVFGNKERKDGFSVKEEDITKIAKAAVKEQKFGMLNQHPLGDYRLHESLKKLLIDHLTVEDQNPVKAKDALRKKHKESLKDLILLEYKKPEDKRVLPPETLNALCAEQNLGTARRILTQETKGFGINQERFEALYEALGSADARKYATALHIEPIALVDAEGYATTPENIAVIVQEKTLDHDSLSSPKITKAALEATVENLFRKLPKGTSAKISADDIEAVVSDFAANLDQEYTHENGKTVKGSLGKSGQLYVFEKLFIEALTVTPAEQEVAAKEALTKDLKKRIKEDILDPKITYLEKYDFLGLVIQAKGQKDKIDETKLDAFFETIGGNDISAGWQMVQGKTAAAEVDIETNESKKTGFAAASTTSKLGMVGTAALGIGLLATSGSKDPEPGQEGQEKQSNFWPNVKKFLGIATLLGAAVWAWKISQLGKTQTLER